MPNEETSTELQDGLYSIHFLDGLTYCFDVAAAGSGRHQNVLVWQYHGGTGQIVNVSKQSGGYLISFPLTGNVMDLQYGIVEDRVEDEVVTQAATRNVVQYPFNNTTAQFWEITNIPSVPAVSLNGQDNLLVYTIQTKVDTRYWVTCDGNIANNSNIKVVRGDTAPSKARVVFCPISVWPEGTYEIIPYIMAPTAALRCSSSASGAKLIITARAEDSNFQVFKVSHDLSGSMNIRCIETGHAFYSPRTGDTWREDDYITTNKWTGSEREQWMVKTAADVSLADVEEFNVKYNPPCRILSKYGNFSPCAEILGIGASPVRIRDKSDSADVKNKQLFYFYPVEAYGKDLAVPSNIEAYCENQYGTLFGIDTPSSNTRSVLVYPAWTGSGEEWKVRYRYRNRKGKQSVNERNQWSSWRSLSYTYEDLETPANSNHDGWGIVGVPNIDAVLGDGRWTSTSGNEVYIGYLSEATDLVELEFQVMQLAHEWGDFSVDAHSGVASKVITIAHKPTLSIVQGSYIEVSKNGVSVQYSVRASKNTLNYLRIWSDDFFEIKKENAVTNGDGSQHYYEAPATLTTKKLKGIPANNEIVVLNWELQSVDGVVNSGSLRKTVRVNWAGLAAIANVVEYWEPKRKLLRLFIPEASNISDVRCWLQLVKPGETGTVSGETIEIEDFVTSSDPAGQYIYIPYPFNKPFKVTVVGQYSSTMRTFIKQYDAVQTSGRMWNFNKTAWCSGELTLDGPPEETVSTKYSNEEHTTTMGKWTRTSMGKVMSQTRSFSSVTVDAFNSEGRSRVQNLAKARYAWYRNQEGEVCRVAIVGVNETKHYWGEEFTVEMRRIDT